MRIKAGKYYLRTEDQFSMWIDEEFQGKDKNGRAKKSTRRVTGYHRDFDGLLASFCRRRINSSEAQDMKELLQDLKQLYEDMKLLKDTAVREEFKRLKKKTGGKK